MKLIVGLGNIGDQYKHTYHNIGFECLDYLSTDAVFEYTKKFRGEIYKRADIIYLKPHTYMNNSGESVVAIKNYYNILDQDIVIIHDDSDILIGEYKIHKNRGSGGHHGVDSIFTHIGKDITRIRIGVRSQRYVGMKAKDFVLRNISQDDDEILKKTYEDINKDMLQMDII